MFWPYHLAWLLIAGKTLKPQPGRPWDQDSGPFGGSGTLLRAWEPQKAGPRRPSQGPATFLALQRALKSTGSPKPQVRQGVQVQPRSGQSLWDSPKAPGDPSCQRAWERARRPPQKGSIRLSWGPPQGPGQLQEAPKKGFLLAGFVSAWGPSKGKGPGRVFRILQESAGLQARCLNRRVQIGRSPAHSKGWDLKRCGWHPTWAKGHFHTTHHSTNASAKRVAQRKRYETKGSGSDKQSYMHRKYKLCENCTQQRCMQGALSYFVCQKSGL